jgi:class 3 adenylate cyclase
MVTMRGDDELKGSPSRLWALIEERARPGSDKEGIDRRIWDLFGETWAVMYTDLAGFSRSVAEFGIVHFLQVIHEHRRLLLPVVAAHDGILVKEEADSLLVLFRHADAAVACGLAMQRAAAEHDLGRPREEQVLLCVGIGHGPVLRIGDADVFGKEVNAASKLGEDVARAGQILLTGEARAASRDVAGARYEDLEAEIPGSDRNFRLVY